MNSARDGQEEATFVSSLPDYAQVYMFLRKFGTLLALPTVSLGDLTDFFQSGHKNEDNEVVGIQWRLLTMVTRREGRKNWQKMATRFAVRSGIIDDVIPYPDIPVEKKVELMKLSCEGQFDCNLPFQAELKKQVLSPDTPVGTDLSGSRYWLLQDANYDVRLYVESGYDVMPPHRASWSLLATSIAELGGCVARLAKRSSEGDEEEENGSDIVGQMEVEIGTDNSGPVKGAQCDERGRGGRRGRGGKGKKSAAVAVEVDGGCLVCRLDNDYQKMLLCDSCDNECHTYCLYPKLWSVPRGQWSCPECNESVLVERLKTAHSELTAARAQLEKATERKQRNVIRLQRSGLLLQNILNNSGSERTRRSRKVVNYAELNDVYLPPLGPNDFVTGGDQPSSTESTERPDQCVATRASRRRRDLCQDLEQYSVNRSEGRVDSHDRLPNSTAVVPPSSVEDRENHGGSKEVGCAPTDVELHRHEHLYSETSTNAVEALLHQFHQGNNDDSHSLTTRVTEPVPIPDHKLPVWNGSATDSGEVKLNAGEINGIFNAPLLTVLPLSEQ